MTVRSIDALTGAETSRPLNQAELDAVAAAAPTLTDVMASRRDEVDDLRDEKSTADFTHGGKVFDANTSAQMSINHAISYGQLNSVADAAARSWTLADNTTETLAWSAIRAMASALFERNDVLYGHARTHKNAINALTTVSAVDAYDITAGW